MKNSTQKHFVNGQEFETKAAVKKFAASKNMIIVKTNVQTHVKGVSGTGAVIAEDIHYTLSKDPFDFL